MIKTILITLSLVVALVLGAAIGGTIQRAKDDYGGVGLYVKLKQQEFFAPKHDHSGECTDLDYQMYEGPIRNVDLIASSISFMPGWRGYHAMELNEEGIVTQMRDGKANFHPMRMGVRIVQGMFFYDITGNPYYLQDAETHANALMERMVEINGGYFFPYGFAFPLHEYDDEVMTPPWYSGISQGAILSGFARLYAATGKSEHKEMADRTFQSLQNRRIGEAEDPHSWIQCVNERGLVWLEEYPTDTPNFVLNGMIYAMQGLHDYHRLEGSEEAERLLRGTIETMRQQVYEFRVEGGISRYCLGHPKGAYRGYHDIHIDQILMLYNMTGDEFFMTAAADFASDVGRDVAEYIRNPVNLKPRVEQE